MLSFDGTSDWFGDTVHPSDCEPLTIACWYYCTDNTNYNGLVRIASEWNAIGAGLYYYQSALYGYVRDSGGVDSFSIASTHNTLHHAALVCHSTTSRYVYEDGEASSENTTSRDPGTTYGTVIGRGSLTSKYSKSEQYFSGSIGEPAIWTAALSASEVAALAAGVCPLLIQPQNLWYYNSFFGDTSGRDWTASGNDLTNQDSVGVSSQYHPTLRPAPILISLGAAAEGGGVVPQIMNTLRQRRAG